MKRRRRYLLAALVAVAAAAGLAVGLVLGLRGGGGGPELPEADVYVSPRGNDDRCVRGDPTRACRTLQAALELAPRPGLVLVRGGLYGDDELGATGPATPVVRFQAAPRERPAFRTLDIGAPGVTLVGINARLTTICGPDARNVSWIGGSIGPWVDDASKVCSAPGPVLFDRVLFHDYERRKPDVHMECLHVWSSQHLTIQRSRFRNCAIMDVFVSNFGPTPPVDDLLISGNTFDSPGSHDERGLSDGFYALAFGPFNKPISNVTISFNSFDGGIGADPGSYPGLKIVANVGQRAAYACAYPGDDWGPKAYSYNVWVNAACGPTDRGVPGPLPFADARNYDLHLEPGSPACDLVPASVEHPETDIDNEERPQGAKLDAGADERSSDC